MKNIIIIVILLIPLTVVCSNDIVGVDFDYNLLETAHDDIRVIISYLDIYAETLAPLPGKRLRESSFDLQIIISRYYINEIYSFLQSMKDLSLIQLTNTEKLENARICVDFYFDDKICFSYSIQAYKTSITINGIQFKNEKLFYDFAYKYLPVIVQGCPESAKESDALFEKSIESFTEFSLLLGALRGRSPR